ncbi:MAG: histidinol dehydrogenase [Dehalococcoidia bacterium]
MLKAIRGLDRAKEALAARRLPDQEPLSPEAEQRIAAAFGQPLPPREVVRRILEDVRSQGDAALRHYTERLDGKTLQELEVSKAEQAQATKQVSPDLIQALKVAAERVRAFHQASLPKSWVDQAQGLGELFTPVERVGIYVPGGTASYPSTVLMTAIPARVAGVSEIFLTTPAREGSLPDPAVLAAAELVGVDRVFRVGGAQAIAALAFGTESIPRVDKVCGPGNIFVTLAKEQLAGSVGIDGLYGPTETVIVADGTASAAFCAADLLAQAEHDPLASPSLITTSQELIANVEKELERQLPQLERREVAQAALDRHGCAILLDSLEEALELANFVAPEHLCLMVQEPWTWAGKVRHAGGLFLGEFSPEVTGDYVAGPSHTMPTGGTARFSSALGVRHFLKSIPVVGLQREQLEKLAPFGATIARAEGLTGHARALELRLREKG